jgi:hypothetical protein
LVIDLSSKLIITSLLLGVAGLKGGLIDICQKGRKGRNARRDEKELITLTERE